MHQTTVSRYDYSVSVHTEIHLCSEHNWYSCFPTDNRSDVRLTDTNDPVNDEMRSVVVHVLLLFINFIQKILNISSVSAAVLKLLFDCLAYYLHITVFAFHQIQIILSGVSAIHTEYHIFSEKFHTPPHCFMPSLAYKFLLSDHQCTLYHLSLPAFQSADILLNILMLL